MGAELKTARPDSTARRGGTVGGRSYRARVSSTQRIIDEAERYVRGLAVDLVRPHPGEFSCNGTHRHAFAYRDAVAPRATALRRRAARFDPAVRELGPGAVVPVIRGTPASS